MSGLVVQAQKLKDNKELFTKSEQLFHFSWLYKSSSGHWLSCQKQLLKKSTYSVVAEIKMYFLLEKGLLKEASLQIMYSEVPRASLSFSNF